MNFFKKKYIVKFEYHEHDTLFSGEAKVHCLPHKVCDIKNKLSESLNNMGNKVENLKVIEITKI